MHFPKRHSPFCERLPATPATHPSFAAHDHRTAPSKALQCPESTLSYCGKTLSYEYPYPVLFSFPALLAQASIRPKTHRPSGINTAPINVKINSSRETADKDAPTRWPGVDAMFPTPTSFRHADSV